MLLPLFGVAQYVLKGKVTDSIAGTGIGFAHVVIEETYKSTTTNEQGEFEIKNLPEGDYNLKISHVSYSSVEKPVSVKKDVLIEIKLIMAVRMGEQFIVTAVRADKNTPSTYTNVDSEVLEDINLGQDIPYLLSITPSTVVSSDAGAGVGYTGIRIRGTDLNRINVTINGIPLNDAESHSVFWVDLPDFASSIDNIQVQRGVGTSTNGAGAFGASINIKTKGINTKPYAETSHSGGSFNTLKNSIGFGSGLINNHFTVDGRISSVVSDGFIDRAKSDLFSYYLSGAYYGKKSIVKFLMWSGKEITYQSWDGIPSYILDTNRTYNGLGAYTDEEGKARYYDNQVDDYKQDHYQLHFSHRINSQWNVNTALHLTKGAGFYEQYKESAKLANYSIPDIINGTDTISRSDLIRRKWLDNRFYGLTFSLNYQNFGKLLFTIGGAANLYDGDHFGRVRWMRNAGISEMDHEWYFSNGLKTDYNIFTRASYNIMPKMNLYGDLQLRRVTHDITGFDDDGRDLTQYHAFNFFNPKAGVSYQHNNYLRTYFSFAVANREPNRSNFTDADPDKPAPVHETLYNLEAGHHVNLNRLAAGINLYYMNYSNQLVLTGEINDVGAPVMTNVDESFRRGIELTAGARITKCLKWDANLTLSQNKIKGFTSYVDNWDTWIQEEESLENVDIAFSPNLIANSIITINPISDLDISLISQYVGDQFIDNTSNENRKLDSYFLNHIRVNYRIKTKLFSEIAFNLMINNLLNEEYESNAWIYRFIENGEETYWDGYFPQAGIHFLAGITLKI